MVYAGLMLLSALIILTALGLGIEALRWALALAALCLVALIAGILTVPRAYSAAGSARIRAGIHQVFDTLENSTEWRTDVQRIEPLESQNGNVRWRETWTPYRVVDMERTESESPSRVVVQATGTNDTYRAVRACNLASLAEGDTLVNVTENGEFHQFSDRIYQHIFASPQSNLDRYLAALSEHFAHPNPATSIHES